MVFNATFNNISVICGGKSSNYSERSARGW